MSAPTYVPDPGPASTGQCGAVEPDSGRTCDRPVEHGGAWHRTGRPGIDYLSWTVKWSGLRGTR
jgi:hypothetical protein